MASKSLEGGQSLRSCINKFIECLINDHKVKRSRGKEGFVEGGEDLIDVLLKFMDGISSNPDFCLTKSNIKAIIFVSIFNIFQKHMDVNNYASKCEHLSNCIYLFSACSDWHI